MARAMPNLHLGGLSRDEDAPRQRRRLATAAMAEPLTVSAGLKALAAPLALSPAAAAAAGPSVGPGAVWFLKIAPPAVCQLLWAAPLPTIREVERKGTTEGLPPLGYFAMAANGFLWMGYGASAGMDPTIIVPNATGMLAGLYYSSKFMQHDSGAFNLTPYKIGTAATFAGVTATVAALPAETAQTVLGWAGCAVVVAMFSGPLQVIKTVLEEKSTKNLPFPMAVATVANCTLWASYGGLVIHDPFIWGPNLLGLSSGLAQMWLFARFGIHREPEADPATAAEPEPDMWDKLRDTHSSSSFSSSSSSSSDGKSK